MVYSKEKYQIYYRKNIEKMIEKNKRYYKKNKHTENIRCRKYHWAHREEINFRKSMYNPIYHNKVNFNGLRNVILERDNWQCVSCKMTNDEHILSFGCAITIDHKDGNRKNNTLSNLQTLCLRCHGHKDGLRNGLKKQIEVVC